MYLPRKKLFNAAGFAQQLEQAETNVPLYKSTLTEGLAFLREHHLAGGSAADVTTHHAWLVDELLCFAWRQHQALLPEKTDIGLVAVGGYGRGELHPYSDIDLLILLKKNSYEQIKEFVETYIQFLWDIGLEIGQSVRSISDSLDQAREDVTVMTNMLETRHLIGDPSLLQQLDDKLRGGKIWPHQKFFEAKLEEQHVRHARYNDTAYNLEPNLKEGPGGLRDLQMIAWVFNRRYGIRNFSGLAEQGFITEDEHRALTRGRNMLWKMRNGLHFMSGRREDRLLFDHQRTLAAEYGYTDNESHLAVEQLMQRYYRTVKEISFQNTLLLEHYRSSALREKRKKSKTENINQRFQVTDGSLEVTQEDVFQKTPSALLEVFHIMQLRPDIEAISPGYVAPDPCQPWIDQPEFP